MEILAKSYENRLKFIDKSLANIQTFQRIMDPFWPVILEKRAPSQNPLPSTQLVTILYQSTQSLERRLKGKADEPVLEVLFDTLDPNGYVVQNSKVAKDALASNNRTTLICIGTFLPTSMAPGAPPGTKDSVQYFSITGVDIK